MALETLVFKYHQKANKEVQKIHSKINFLCA